MMTAPLSIPPICFRCVRRTFWFGEALISSDLSPHHLWPLHIQQYLNQQQIKTTFFTIGSRVLQFPNTAREEYMAGHQLGVHTWSHPYLTTLTNEQIIAELGWTRQAIRDVIGVSPSMMRPPYGDIE